MASTDDLILSESELNAATAPLFMAIGHVAHHWSALEYEINKLIWKIAGVEESDGACITAQIPSIMPRFRALISLAHKHGCSDATIKELNRFSTKADGVARQRNRVIHDPWFFRLNPEVEQLEYGRLEITADRKLVYEVKPKTVKEVLGIAHEIIDAKKTFMEIRSKIETELKLET